MRFKDNNEGSGATGGDDVGGATGGGATGDDIEVGPGFAAAAEAQASDDTRTPEQRGGATQDLDEAGDNEGEGEGEGEGNEQKEPLKKKNRETAAYIRDIKRESREAKAAASALGARLAALEKGGLPNSNSGGNSSDTSGKPDPTDAAKYPFGVLDDGYNADLIHWDVNRQVTAAIGKLQQTEQNQQEKAGLVLQLKALTDQGAEIFDDFEDVVEAGMREEWPLTKTTFIEAAKVANGAAVLHALANDPEEALWLSEQSPAKQRAYVAEKNAEIEGEKPKPRTVPKAGNPPSDLPRGRNSSAPIRADTDNLDDFRKLFYQK